jgi:hypothetical protein
MSVLDYMTRMSDRELKYDLQFILDAAHPREHEQIERYREARMRAPGFQPGRPGANNHGNVKLPKAGAERVCECGCGQSLPKLADSRRKFASGACRVRALRSSQVDSKGLRHVYDESPSSTTDVTELSADGGDSDGLFRRSLTAPIMARAWTATCVVITYQ